MNLGIIGCGGMGAVAAEMAANCGLTVAACGDAVPEKAESLAAKYGAAVERDCFKLAGSGSLDVIAITTPTPAHTPYVVSAAQAGKHIFCEKPFGRTLAQCKEALSAVKKAKVKLFVGHVLRYFQEFEALKGQIDAGQVGRPGSVRTYRGGIFPVGEGRWYRDYEQSGGVTLDCIIHDFDWLRYVFGEVSQVYCQAIQRTEPEVLDYAMVTLRMQNGMLATVTGTWAHPSGFRVKAEVCGDEGMLLYDSKDAPVTVMPRVSAGGGPGMIMPGSPVPKSPYQLEWEDFVRWIEQGQAPKVQPDDALEAVRIGLAALESAAAGKAVRLQGR